MAETRRIERVVVLLTAEEKNQVRANCKLQNMALSDYVRSMILHKRPESHNEIPDAAPTVAPNEPLPPRDEFEGLSQEDEFKRRVNRHALRMPRRKAEAIVKKEMRIE